MEGGKEAQKGSQNGEANQGRKLSVQDAPNGTNDGLED